MSDSFRDGYSELHESCASTSRPNRSRDEVISSYERSAGWSLSHLHYFEILQCFFLATALIRQADMRIARGTLPPTSTMAWENVVMQMLAMRLGMPPPKLSPDYLQHRSEIRTSSPSG
ncbi:hypothetical protein [Rhodococcus sp. SJ-3]|uniref:hypothetical protein n=1 Tax=Rhodococcus sp. SJ-3 TaxID=3454628 RepID=UPI003F7B2CC9